MSKQRSKTGTQAKRAEAKAEKALEKASLRKLLEQPEVRKAVAALMKNPTNPVARARITNAILAAQTMSVYDAVRIAAKFGKRSWQWAESRWPKKQDIFLENFDPRKLTDEQLADIAAGKGPRGD